MREYTLSPDKLASILLPQILNSSPDLIAIALYLRYSVKKK